MSTATINKSRVYSSGNCKEQADYQGASEEFLLQRMKDFEYKAWCSLTKYEFDSFGKQATKWMSYNKQLKYPQKCPFIGLVKIAGDVRT